MARVLGCFEVTEKTPWTAEACVAHLNAELAQRHIEADQIISITPIMDTTAFRVFYWTTG